MSISARKPNEKDINPETGEVIKRNEYRKMGVYDFVRRDIERYFAHPEEAIVVPQVEPPRLPKAPPDFVRNVWGSAAGVGSGDFHIYRGIRRREFARLDLIDQAAQDEILNKEFQEKQRQLDELAATKTAKKRAKRQKKKLKRLGRGKQTPNKHNSSSDDDDDDDSNDGVQARTDTTESCDVEGTSPNKQQQQQQQEEDTKADD